MKKLSKLFLLVLYFAICLFSAGCLRTGVQDNSKNDLPGDSTTDNTENNKPDNKPTNPPEIQLPEGDYIYADGSKLQIVYPKGDDKAAKIAEELYMDLLSYTYSYIYIVDDSQTDITEHLITVGNTNREITDLAYSELKGIDFDPSKENRYLAYTDGNSIALVYDENIFDIDLAAKEATQVFIENYVKKNETLFLNPGVVYTDKVTPTLYQTELDKIKIDNEWKKLYEELGGNEEAAAVVAAFKNYYAEICSPELIDWFANLYDPVTGGFYYCNSARDSDGFGVDVESTSQTMAFLEGSGMTSSFGGVKNLPRNILDTLGIWVKSLQDPNGFFYHPQWTKELIDSKLSRRARDLNQALSLLSITGYSPTYTVNGRQGDYTLVDGTRVDALGNPISAESKLTGKLAYSSPYYAASKVLAASSTVPSHLQDAPSFEKYLNSLDIRNNSYSVGNTLAAQGTQIKSRDKELGGGVLIPVIEQYLKDNQNPENGTWDWSNSGRLVANNGFMKITTLYNELGIEIPNPEKGIENALAILLEDTKTVHVCDTYNTWFTINNVYSNLRKFTKNSTATEAQIKAIQDNILSNAERLITATKDRLLEHKKADSSYSYYKKTTSAESQGVLVANGQNNEGDVNATYISTVGTIGHMMDAFGVSMPRIYGAEEYCHFIFTLLGTDSIVKEVKPDPITFDDAVNESELENITVTKNSSGQIEVIKDLRNPDGSLLLFDSKNDGQDRVKISSTTDKNGVTKFVFEADINVISGDNGIISQICFGDAYMLALSVSEGKVHFSDRSSVIPQNSVNHDLDIAIALGSWFNLKVEYYPGEHDTVYILIYINGSVVAKSNNYYDEAGDKISAAGTPALDFDNVEIIGFSTNNIKLMLDNVYVY